MKKGILLINLGTPDAPTTSAVRRYLREFLTDPRVIDIPRIARYLLVYGVILPFRPKRAKEAYAKIWTKEGSPLRMHGEQLVKKLTAALGDGYVVSLGMRYGYPSIEKGLQLLLAAQCEEITVIPLFPQYSSAATGSALEKFFQIIRTKNNIPHLKIWSSFYQSPQFIQAYAEKIRTQLMGQKIDHLLLSYHGLPVRHMKKAGCSVGCVTAPCPAIQADYAYCYRAQCYATSRAIAAQLDWPVAEYSTAFQSRLGRTPWIFPYTDEILVALIAQGVRHLAVACPSFVADCLETLEEIGLRAKAQWLALGGESLHLVPCLNTDPLWVTALKNWIQQGTMDE